MSWCNGMTEEVGGPEATPAGAWTVEVGRGTAKEEMRRIVDRCAASGVEVLVCRRDMVFGLDHIASALEHASRSIRDGRNASESLAMETLLYISGERQLSSAIAKMAVEDGTILLAVAQLTDGPTAREDGWEDMPASDAPVEPSRLQAFGISKEELGTVAPGRGMELVLERVASVDVTKR